MKRWSDKLNRETRTGTRGGKSEKEKAKRRKRKRVRAEEGVRCKGAERRVKERRFYARRGLRLSLRREVSVPQPLP